MKSVRSEMVALAIALALPASVALVLPYSAIWRAPAEPVRDAPPFAAFVTLTADEEAQAMRRAKSAGRSGEAADARRTHALAVPADARGGASGADCV